MYISQPCKTALMRLEERGFQAFLVGGCVRDQLLGRPVHDFDVTTDALPEQIMEAFADFRTIPTGLKHGTVTVLIGSEPIEITTFRVDRDYSDCRRPDSVEFTSDVTLDLARRDFTMNAVAMDIRGKVMDPFGGISDINSGIIRCVGAPRLRFSEDALRIMRAVRFAAQLGFRIEDETFREVIALKGNLAHVSRERLRDELDKLIMGRYCADVLLSCREVIAEFIPEFRPCFDFDQHSRYHRYNVYEHIARAVQAAPEKPVFRRTMLFHDIGKPPMFTMDEAGEGHFKGHAGVSADMAGLIMRRLRYSSADIAVVCELIAHHSDKVSTERQIKRIIAKQGLQYFLMLMEVKKSDNLAKNDFVLEENAYFDQCAAAARRLVEEDNCFSLKDLAVNGRDMLALGLSGRDIGLTLDRLLELVMDNALPNDRLTLLRFVKEELS